MGGDHGQDRCAVCSSWYSADGMGRRSGSGGDDQDRAYRSAERTVRGSGTSPDCSDSHFSPITIYGSPIATMTLEHHYADLPNGMRLHYVAAGSGPLLVFVHGFPEFWYEWKEQLAEFSRDHRAVALDMRG